MKNYTEKSRKQQTETEKQGQSEQGKETLQKKKKTRQLTEQEKAERSKAKKETLQKEKKRKKEIMGRIQKALGALNKKNCEIAELCDVDNSAFSNWFKRDTISMELLRILHTEFHFDLNYIICGTDLTNEEATKIYEEMSKLNKEMSEKNAKMSNLLKNYSYTWQNPSR